MTFATFHLHLWECHVGVATMSLGAPIVQVVIRCETMDREVAAIHKEGNVLIFDLGQKIDESR